MKKLSIVFAIFALATTLGVTGCKKKKEEAPATDPAAKTTDPAGSAAAPTPTPDPAAGSAAAPADPAAPAAAAGDLPAECNDYKAMIDKLATCDKLPQQSRDALKQGYDAMSASWANAATMPAEAKKAMGDSCKQAAEALKTAAGTTCGW
jgi:hypothetical protein